MRSQAPSSACRKHARASILVPVSSAPSSVRFYVAIATLWISVSAVPAAQGTPRTGWCYPGVRRSKPKFRRRFWIWPFAAINRVLRRKQALTWARLQPAAGRDPRGEVALLRASRSCSSYASPVRTGLFLLLGRFVLLGRVVLLVCRPFAR